MISRISQARPNASCPGNDWVWVPAGYRHLEVDYENDGLVWDVEMSGPIVGATFRF